MKKLSGAQVNEMLKTSAASLRALSEENQTLRTKVAHFEKKERAESIALAMEEKGMNDHLDHSEKIASIMERDEKGMTVLEEAVNLSAPQMKLASVNEDGIVPSEGSAETEMAESNFAAALATLD